MIVVHVVVVWVVVRMVVVLMWYGGECCGEFIEVFGVRGCDGGKWDGQFGRCCVSYRLWWGAGCSYE